MVSKNIIVTLFVTAAAAAPETGAAQKAAYNTPGAGNPILPGYFADPTIKKFGDTYYIYATTDGSGAGFGPAIMHLLISQVSSVSMLTATSLAIRCSTCTTM